VGYLGDLKISPGARGGLVLARLAREATSWLQARVNAALGIVMDGTSVVPPMYTGRAGVHAFAPAGSITLLRMQTAAGGTAMTATIAQAGQCLADLTRGHAVLPMGTSALRSDMEPVALVHPSRTACGVIENTRDAKRLYQVGGDELVSAHVSGFAFSDPESGAALLRCAMGLAAAQGVPALFVAVPSPRAQGLVEALDLPGLTVATATIYAAALPAYDLWHINTSEI
jgi:hypothetical protein